MKKIHSVLPKLIAVVLLLGTIYTGNVYAVACTTGTEVYSDWTFVDGDSINFTLNGNNATITKDAPTAANFNS
ncbi:MAG: hypothetical protein QM504_02905, partial [Pseudomonadota bacterium]